MISHKYNKKIWISRFFNPIVLIGSYFLKPFPKMFADSYYIPEMLKYDFEYQLVLFVDSQNRIEITEENRKMK